MIVSINPTLITPKCMNPKAAPPERSKADLPNECRVSLRKPSFCSIILVGCVCPIVEKTRGMLEARDD